MEHEHTTSYENKQYDIGYCDHTPVRKDGTYRKGYTHYRIGKTVYKKKQKFLEALKDVALIFLMLFSLSAQAQTARVNVTYYSLRGKTASGIQARQGVCAVSPDLERRGFCMGKRVSVEGYGTYLIADRTSRRLRNTVDIWSRTKIKNGKNIKIKLIK